MTTSHSDFCNEHLKDRKAWSVYIYCPGVTSFELSNSVKKNEEYKAKFLCAAWNENDVTPSSTGVLQDFARWRLNISRQSITPRNRPCFLEYSSFDYFLDIFSLSHITTYKKCTDLKLDWQDCFMQVRFSGDSKGSTTFIMKETMKVNSVWENFLGLK